MLKIIDNCRKRPHTNELTPYLIMMDENKKKKIIAYTAGIAVVVSIVLCIIFSDEILAWIEGAMLTIMKVALIFLLGWVTGRYVRFRSESQDAKEKK